MSLGCMNNRKKLYLGLCFATLALVLMLTLVNVASRRELRRLSPPQEVSQFSEFSKVMSPPASLRLTAVDAQAYLLWTGKVAEGWRLPSGPPAYVFDKTGRLVEWRADNRDDPSFYGKWYG